MPMKTLTLESRRREEFIKITDAVQKAVTDLGVKEGLCVVFVPHTTAGVTINENADPDVQRDMLLAIQKIVPGDLDYRHGEGNSPAHLKSSLLGCSQQVLVEGGRLALGMWQGIYFCEFDGPRTRKIYVKVT